MRVAPAVDAAGAGEWMRGADIPEEENSMAEHETKGKWQMEMTYTTSDFKRWGAQGGAVHTPVKIGTKRARELGLMAAKARARKRKELEKART